MNKKQKIYKLYEIPRGSTIEADEGIITFHHLDGMYSYCTVDWSKGVLHLSVNTDLIKLAPNKYKLCS